MRGQERARLAECDDCEDEASLRAHLAWLDQAIAQADAALRALIEDNEELRQCERRIRTVPGVGAVTAVTLLALMPELGRRSPKTVAALAGLAPYAHESGRFKGARSVRGGRKTVRDAHYMAALTAARSKTALGDYARNLSARGKPPKLVLIALARKLITLVNAIVRDQTTFKAA
jgi:transposase